MLSVCENRNGTIDFFRFIFSVSLAFGHWGYFPNSYLVVEYFFIISGYFMCVAAKKSTETIGKSTAIFMRKKVKRVLPCVWVTFLFVNICNVIFYDVKYSMFEWVHVITQSIWELFFCTMSGLGITYNKFRKF